MPYNKPYYPTLVEAMGYKKDVDLLAFHITSQTVTKERFEKVAERIAPNGVKIRFIDDKNLATEMVKIKEIYNNLYANNWGCVPMTDEEFDANVYYFKKVFVRELTFIAELDSRAIGFAFATPDFNQIFSKLNGRLFPFGWLKLWLGKNKVRVIRMMEIGILPEYRNKGIGALFFLEFVKAAARRGDEWCELSWVPETNLIEVKQLLKIGAKRYKTYRIYEKQL